MTVIVGLVDNGTVYIGADSVTTDTTTYESKRRKYPKIAIIGEMILGACGSPRIGQLLHHAFCPPPLPDDGDLLQYIVVDLIDALKICLGRDDSNIREGSSLMIGIRGHLYCIHDDNQVEEVSYGYNAIGAGADIALGSLHTTQALPPDSLAPQDRLCLALEAAREHNATVREPFIYLQC